MGQKITVHNIIQKIKKFMEEQPLFLLTVAVFLFLHIEQEYRHLISYRFVYNEMLELLLAPFLIWGISFLIVRDMQKSALLALIFILIFYFFCDLKDWLHEEVPGLFFSKYTFLLPFIALCLVFAFFHIKQLTTTKRSFLFINTLFILFILADSLRIAGNTSIKKNDLGDRKKTISSAYISCKDCLKPDIYYIIFDAYPSSKILHQEFGYDNNDIDTYLKNKGFFTIQNSTSNYNFTPFSIASCFNLNYLSRVNLEQKFYIKEYLPAINAVYLSELTEILKKEGYDIINHSIFDIKNYPTTNSPDNLWSIDLIYERHNIFKKIDSDIGWLIKQKIGIRNKNQSDIKYIEQKDRHFVKTVNSLITTSGTSSNNPQFIYGHLVLPHLPSAFDSVGNKTPVSGEPLSEAENRRRYIQLVSLSNKIMKKIIDSIFSNINRPLVIIIQSDHGYLFREPSKKELEFANLNTFYFYNKNYRLLHDSMSNVNTFRVIFNTFFKKNYPLLKDTSYYFNHK